MGSAIEFIQHIEFIYLLCHLADEKIDIVLGDVQATMPKQFRERNNIATVNDPLLGKGMPISMNTGSLDTTTLIIFIEHVITGTLRELLTEAITEQIIVIRLDLCSTRPMHISGIDAYGQ